MAKSSALRVYIDAPRGIRPVLVSTAKSGIYLVRGIPRDLQRSARVRAVRETTTLSVVLRQALARVLGRHLDATPRGVI